MLIELLPQPLLAAFDIGSIIFFLFLLFSFFGFINNLIKGNAGNQQQARGRQPRRGGELQNEIDDFLKEVLGDEPAKMKQRAQVEFMDDDLEIIDEPETVRLEQQERARQERDRQQRQRELRQQEERERREQQRRKQEADERRSESRQRKQKAAPVQFEEQPGRKQQKLKDRHLDSHVKSSLTHEVADQHLSKGSVAPVVGVGLADYSDQSGIDQSSQVAQDLHAILQSPQGVRQAILMNEILSQPKGLQSHSG